MSPHPPDDKRTVRVPLLLTPDEARELDDWQFSNRLRTRRAAQRCHSPRSIRIGHGTSDRDVVANYAFRCSSSAEQADRLVRLWDTQARELVRRWWDAIERVATALLERESLSGDDVKRLLLK